MFEEIIEEKAGLVLKIAVDEDAQDPRIDYDNFGTMVCWNRRHSLGDKHEYKTPANFLEWWKENGKDGVLLALGLLDHSGLHMYLGSEAHFTDSAGWDSGQCGWIYATAETIRKEYGKSITKAVRKKTEKLLQCEVETYDQYLTGDVWGYIVENENEESLDSCWGFYGREYAEQEARESFAHYVKKQLAVSFHVESANTEEMDVTS